MPTLGMTGTSLWRSQSQSGDTSSTRLTWKDGLPSRTALVYSAIFLFMTGLASSHFVMMAPAGQ